MLTFDQQCDLIAAALAVHNRAETVADKPMIDECRALVARMQSILDAATPCAAAAS